MERACGDLGEGGFARAYAEGRYLDLLEWYVDTTSCRHVIFEKYVGDPSRNVEPCTGGESACDNCRRSATGASLVVRRGEWLGPPVALCDGGDGHARRQLRHLQPYVVEAATIYNKGCNRSQ